MSNEKIYKCKACGSTDYELLVIDEERGNFDARCKACYTVIPLKKTPIKIQVVERPYLVDYPNFYGLLGKPVP